MCEERLGSFYTAGHPDIISSPSAKPKTMKKYINVGLLLAASASFCGAATLDKYDSSNGGTINGQYIGVSIPAGCSVYSYAEATANGSNNSSVAINVTHQTAGFVHSINASTAAQGGGTATAQKTTPSKPSGLYNVYHSGGVASGGFGSALTRFTW